MLSTALLAAELVPGWFAAAFWLAFVALVAIVVRDVRRAGGVRRVVEAVNGAIERRGAETRRGPDAGDGCDLSEDPTRPRR